MTTCLRRLLGAVLMTAAVAALPAAPALAETPVVPILNGGQVHWVGSASRTYHGRSVDEAGGATTNDAQSAVSWDTILLLPGHYPDDPPTPLTDPATGTNFVLPLKADSTLGSGSEHSVYDCGGSLDPDCQGSSESCTWTESTNGQTAGLIDPAHRQWVIASLGAWITGTDSTCADEYDLYGPTLWTNCRANVAPDDQADVCGTVFAFPDTPSEGDATTITRHFDHAMGAADCDRIDESYSCTQAGQSTMTISCALCVTQVQYQQPDLPGRGWTDVPDSGTFDGNHVRITATIHNATPKDITAPVRFRDLTTQHDLPAMAGTQPPPDQVSFPANADTTVVLDWDTDGFAWYDPHTADPHRIAVLTPYGAARRDLAVRPKPVLLVHGFASNAGTWAGYDANFTGVRSDWVVRAADGMDTNPVNGNTVFQNGQILGRDIDKVREDLDAEHVDLVVHSMGGLISRSYLHYQAPDDPDQRPVVAHLVMLGTPNEGSTCAHIAYGVAWEVSELPGAGGGAKTFGNAEGAPSLELMPEYVQYVFNVRVTDTKGTKLSVLAGHAPSGFQNAAHLLCGLEKPNDVVVSQRSAFWTLTDTATQDGLMHTSMTKDATAFRTFVAPHLEVTPDGATPRAAPASSPVARAASAAGARSAAASPKAPSSATGGLGLALVTRSMVPAHATRRVRIPVHSGHRLGVVLLGAGGIDAKLVDPKGRTAASATGDGLSALMATTRRRGRWTLALHNTGTARADVAVGAVIDGDRYRVTPKLRTAGRRLALSVSVHGAGGRPKAKAYARPLDGSGKLVKVHLRRHGSTFHAKVKRFAAGTAVLVRAHGRHGTRVATVTLPARHPGAP
ncbi:MAG TPA: hypothetical protein VFT50_12425 [Baekduia sp.]|nr:hypothetical protein [Baekduia sp.]